jgi:peptidoglycan/LPS O-acetylase OafA/YrhL
MDSEEKSARASATTNNLPGIMFPSTDRAALQPADHFEISESAFEADVSVSCPRALVNEASGIANTEPRRFYRPELDALRFFAFVAVLLHHGPHDRYLLGAVSRAGGFGLSMFFLLSAYLITELLLREREQTGNIAWNLFFIRRALRIWPLYYLSLAAGIIIASIFPHRYWISRTGVALMSVFVANWFRVGSRMGLLIGHLWSISVEEQFYLIWAPVIKFGGETLAFLTSAGFVVLAVVWLRLFVSKGWALWYDTPVEFLFFAAGAIISLVTRSRAVRNLDGGSRTRLIAAGLFILMISEHFGRVGTDDVSGLTLHRLYLGYGGAALACVIIFVAFLGMSSIPQPFIYLGKISYGLYVFHIAMLQLSMWLISPLHLTFASPLTMVLADGIALALCICLSHFSYKYFESPFLKLKDRIAPVHSRPV